jgi:hypothetical protein
MDEETFAPSSTIVPTMLRLRPHDEIEVTVNGRTVCRGFEECSQYLKLRYTVQFKTTNEQLDNLFRNAP